MKLIFALGNPEKRYDSTRHNVGYWLADFYAAESGSTWTEKSKFKAIVTEQGSGDEKVVIAKPTTYYNNVGESFRALLDFYNLDQSDVLIIADDLALPFGTIRTRIGGSDAGNNGIKSINMHGGAETNRLRIGIGNELKERMNDADFVLSRFSKNEAVVLTREAPAFLEIIAEFIEDNFNPTTHSFEV